MSFKLVHENTKFIPYLSGDDDSLERAIEQVSDDVIFIDIPQDLQIVEGCVIQPRYGLELIAQLDLENIHFSDMASYITDVTPFYCHVDFAYFEECMRNHLIARRAFLYSSRESSPCAVLCKDISLLQIYLHYVGLSRFNTESLDAHLADSENEFKNSFIPKIGRLQLLSPPICDVNCAAEQIRTYTAKYSKSQWNQQMFTSFVEVLKLHAQATYGVLRQELLGDGVSLEIDEQRQILQTKIDDGSAAQEYAL